MFLYRRKMFTKETLTEMFKEKEFGYGKWHLYFYSEGDFSIEEQDCDVEVLDGVVKITTYTQKAETYERDEWEGENYIPFERITQISFTQDF